MFRSIFKKFALIFIIGAAFGASGAAGQETLQPNDVSEIVDLNQKVFAGQQTTYLELVRLVFPKIERLYGVGSAYSPSARSYFRYGAESSPPLRPLTGKSLPARRNYLFRIESVKALALDQKRRRIALTIRAEASEKNNPDFETLAVFALAPKPKLLAAFVAGKNQRLDFGREPNFFEEERQFWISSEKKAFDWTPREKRYFLLELMNETARVVIDDVPAPQSEKSCGAEYSYDARYVSQLMCGQEVFAGGRRIFVLRLFEEWQPKAENCGATSLPVMPHKREREYEFRWNKRLARYEKTIARDDILESESSPRDYKIETGFAGFALPRGLSGDAVFMTRVYDLTLYGGEENWRWSGAFRQPSRRSRSLVTFGFYKELSDFTPQKYGKRKYRVDIRFIVTGIRLGQSADGSWSNQYECLVIAAKER